MNEANKDPEVHSIIDDAQYIMATGAFMDKAMVKGYDKFTLMARKHLGNLSPSPQNFGRTKIYFLTHEEETNTGEEDENSGPTS